MELVIFKDVFMTSDKTRLIVILVNVQNVSASVRINWQYCQRSKCIVTLEFVDSLFEISNMYMYELTCSLLAKRLNLVMLRELVRLEIHVVNCWS